MEGEHLNLVLNLLRVVSDERLAVVGWPLVVLAPILYLGAVRAHVVSKM